MEAIAKKLIQITARNPVTWFLYRICGGLSNILGRIYRYAQSMRKTDDGRRLAEITDTLFPDLKVANGPFRNMRYPSAQSICSTLLPKLLGSYESELHPVLDEMLTNKYTSIVDIGCAEGYYAIGLALRLPDAEVFTFDTNPRAKQLCLEMARINGVADRIHMNDFCDAEVLRSLPLGDRALIISDCEGYEGALFNKRMAEFLVQHDVIVEMHDFLDIEISAKMRDAFAQTHHIRSVKSIDDIEKAHNCHDRALEAYSTRDKHLILKEERPTIMEWLIVTRKERPIKQVGRTRGSVAVSAPDTGFSKTLACS